MTIAVYAGSFDPPTLGHLDVIFRCEPLFEKIILVVANNTQKKTLFSAQERKELLEKAVNESVNSRAIDVDITETLIVEYCKSAGANVLIRGIRAVSDFEHEFQVASMNKVLDPSIESFHIMTDKKYSYVSSSLVKEVARFGGDLSELVPQCVKEAMRQKYAK